MIEVDYKLAREKGLKLIESTKLTAAHPEWFEFDGVHPDDAGAKGIAQAVYQAIKPKIDYRLPITLSYTQVLVRYHLRNNR